MSNGSQRPVFEKIAEISKGPSVEFGVMVGKPPNVMWLTLESVRADHTTMNGYDRNTTPAIQQLVKESNATSFENE